MKICKLICCFVFLVFSCKKKDIVSQITLPTISSQETKLTPNEILALQTSYGKTKVEESEAAEIALDFVRFAEVNSKNVNARSSADAGRFLADSKVVWLNQNATKNIQGRVLDDSIPLYVYQFRTALDNTAGFAIVSGDTRLPQVLACTFDGSIEDTLKETGAKILIANISSFVEYEIERQNIELQTQLSSALEKIKRQMPDSIKQILDPKAEVKGNLKMEGTQIWQLQNVKLGNWETLASLGPLLKTKWGQGYPYNLKIPYACNGVRAPVGCQATAAAQIMAYWRFPNTYNGVTINWDNIVNWSQNTLPIYLLFVTVAQLANMNYGCTQSGTYDYNIFKSYTA